MSHPHRPSQWRISLHIDVVLGTRLTDGCLRVKGMNFNLINERGYFRIRSHQLFNLYSRGIASAHNTSRTNKRCLLPPPQRPVAEGHTHMSNTKVAHTSHLDLPSLDGILQRLPARQTCLLAAVRAVQQEEVHVAQPRHIHGLLDTAAHLLVVGAAAGQLRGVVDVLALEAVGVLGAAEPVQDRLARLALVVVHLG